MHAVRARVLTCNTPETYKRMFYFSRTYRVRAKRGVNRQRPSYSPGRRTLAPYRLDPRTRDVRTYRFFRVTRVRCRPTGGISVTPAWSGGKLSSDWDVTVVKASYRRIRRGSDRESLLLDARKSREIERNPTLTVVCRHRTSFLKRTMRRMHTERRANGRCLKGFRTAGRRKGRGKAVERDRKGRRNDGRRVVGGSAKILEPRIRFTSDTLGQINRKINTGIAGIQVLRKTIVCRPIINVLGH